MMIRLNILIGYIRFHSRSLFSFPGFDWGKNVVIFGVENSSSVHIDSKKKYLSS